MQREAQLAEQAFGHLCESREIERDGVGGDVCLIDGPFEPRDIAKMRKLPCRWVRRKKAREITTVAVHIPAWRGVRAHEGVDRRREKRVAHQTMHDRIRRGEHL